MGLAAIWATLTLVYLALRPAHERERWTWEYYVRARALIEEAREHQASLEQAMEELVNASRQIALANERLGILRQVAEEARESKASFVAQVSHEFRTPLNMIIGLVSLIMEPPAGEAPTYPRKFARTWRSCTATASTWLE